MNLEIYQVDAFTSNSFGGNPAAVVPLTEWLPDELMLKIAAENNLSETAFFVKDGATTSAGSPRRSRSIYAGTRRWRART
jgi:PhzF family phenazine biosynthesis protein